MIGLRETSSGEVLWSVIPCGSLSLALSEWEAIRAYMENGIDSLPTNYSDELEEGTVEFFKLCRESYREEYSLVRYIWGFIIIQLFSGWTLPCHISEWINSRPKALFPKEVLEWSTPLPLADHAKPSKELVAETEEIRKHFARGQTLLDYFGLKPSSMNTNSETRK